MARWLATLLVVPVVIAACGAPSGTLYSTVLRNPDGSYSLPVTVGDETGLVTGIEGTTNDSNFGLQATVEADGLNPSAFLVSWLGGACTDSASISIRKTEKGYTVHLQV